MTGCLAGVLVLSYIDLANAGIAQLVERNLAKVDVAGSNPVSRSALRGRGQSVIAPSVSVKHTSSLKWPRRPQSHQVAGLFLCRGRCSELTVIYGDVPKW